MPDGARAGHGPPPRLPVPRNRHLRKPAPASTSSTIAVTYDPTKAATLQAMPTPHPGFLEQALRKSDQPEPAPILDPGGEPISRPLATGGAPLTQVVGHVVHAHLDLGVDGRLGAYKCVGPKRQLNVLLTHVLFGEETKDFLDALSLAYHRHSLLAPTIIIGDLNATPTDDDRTSQPTATH